MNNILIDENILEEAKSSNDFETNMLIAELNLKDYNKRLGTSHDLIYKKINEKLKFVLDDSDNISFDIAENINFFILWNSEKIDKSYFRIYYDNINSFEYSQITFYNSPHIPKDDKYQKAKENFIKKYADYSPLGFLSEEESQSVKSEISKRFLTSLI